MSMPIKLPPPTMAAVDETRVLSPEFSRYLQGILWEAHRSFVPPKGIIPCYLLAADIAAEFDGTGLGRKDGPYQWWALCNGLNGTPDLTDLYLKHSNVTAGNASGSFTTSGSSAANAGDASPDTGEPSVANTGASGILTTGQPSATLNNITVTGAQRAGSQTHTHDLATHTHTLSAHKHTVAAHGHTIAHTHTAEPPSTTLVYIMRML